LEAGGTDPNTNDLSVLSEGHHAEIKELEGILKTQMNDEVLKRALKQEEVNTPRLNNPLAPSESL